MKNKMDSSSRSRKIHMKQAAVADERKRTKSIKTFDKKLSRDELAKEMKKKQEYSRFKKEEVGSMGGRKSGKVVTKTKPNTKKTRTTTRIGGYHKGKDEYSGGAVKGPKGQEQHWHDLGERTTKTKVKKKKKGTKVVTHDYRSTPDRPNPYGERRRTVTWK